MHDARLQSHVSHYNLITDAQVGVSRITNPKKQKKYKMTSLTVSTTVVLQTRCDPAASRSTVGLEILHKKKEGNF
jgi:hypothetical protein